MTEFFESPGAVGLNLGKHLPLLKGLDPLSKHRADTTRFRKSLLKRYGPRCGFHRQLVRPDELETAHVIPLEIGGETTEHNLILLCRSCHKHYDRGCLSINAMLKVADEWESQARGLVARPPLTLDLITPPVKPDGATVLEQITSEVAILHRDRKFALATKLIERALIEEKLTRGEQIYLLIRRAEFTRRRAANGTMGLSLHRFKEINCDEVPRRYQALYFYHLGYAFRLVGEHSNAYEMMSLCLRKLGKGNKNSFGIDYVVAAANQTLCEMASIDRFGKAEAKEYENLFNKLMVVAQRGDRSWAWERVRNCARIVLIVRIKAGDGSGSWDALREFRHICYEQDINSGWEAAAKQEISQMEGLVRVFFPRDENDLEVGIGLLARSLRARLGRRQRPEGIRDVGFALAIGLRKQRRKKGVTPLADKLEDVMSRTVDGTSEIWPWRAVNYKIVT